MCICLHYGSFVSSWLDHFLLTCSSEITGVNYIPFCKQQFKRKPLSLSQTSISIFYIFAWVCTWVVFKMDPMICLWHLSTYGGCDERTLNSLRMAWSSSAFTQNCTQNVRQIGQLERKRVAVMSTTLYFLLAPVYLISLLSEYIWDVFMQHIFLEIAWNKLGVYTHRAYVREIIFPLCRMVWNLRCKETIWMTLLYFSEMNCSDNCFSFGIIYPGRPLIHQLLLKKGRILINEIPTVV